MKKFIIALIASISITLTSCGTYAQASTYDEGFVYEYSYYNYPVRYINDLPYYFCMTNDVWQWVVVPQIHHHLIVHHPRPMRYFHPHRPYHHFHAQPVKPHAHPARPHHGNMHRVPNSIHRPNHGHPGGGMHHPSGGGRHSGGSAHHHPGGGHSSHRR